MKTFYPLAVVLALLVSCDAQYASDNTIGHTRSVTQTIVNGTRDPQAVLLTDAQIMAIGWLYPAGSPRTPFCTATLVAPDLVVTAQHCTSGSSAGDIGFGVGMDPDEYEALFAAAAIYPNRQADAAFIVLDAPATESGLDIEPIPINSHEIDDSAVGRAVQAGGYGETYDRTRDGRWFATVYIDQVRNDEIVVDGRGEQGICFGDSGSALIDLDDEGNPVILAVESYGDESCVDEDHMTRLDVIYDWIGPILDGEVPEDPCAGIPREGRCVGNVLETCRRDNYQMTDCTDLGTECTYVEGAERYACACGELGEVGRCDGDRVEFCRDGRYISFNCSFRGGLTCGYSNSEGRYFCVESPVCLPDDEIGRCDGDVAIHCSDGYTTRQLCSVEGGSCVETDDGVECLAPEPVDVPGDDAEADAGVPGGFPDLADVNPQSPTVNDGAKEAGGSDDCGCLTAEGSPRRPTAHIVAIGLLAALFVTRRRGRANTG